MTLTWNSIISAEKKKAYYQSMSEKIDAQRSLGKSIFPKEDHIFTAFDLTPFNDVKVVILGQDPYHGGGSSTWFVLFCVTRGKNPSFFT